jgi:hypothetical protein
VFDQKAEGYNADVHIDEQYERVIALDHVEWTDPFSVTVPICLPENGVHGLDIWYNTLGDAELVEYKLGKMYIHSGKQLHCIHKPEQMGVGDNRITLQAHGVNTAEGIILYW